MRKMNIVMVPFHDYKKWATEGFRTRDAHLFQHFAKNDMVDKILVINRPVSLAESLVRGKSWRTPMGEVVLKCRDWQLSRVSDKCYFIDFRSKEFLKVLLRRRKWWNDIFKERWIMDAILEAESYLNMKNSVLFLENPMAIGIVGSIKEDVFVFDAIDDWTKHPQMKNELAIIKQNYRFIGSRADYITTVSNDLRGFFEKYNNNVRWVPNGVDFEFFSSSLGINENKRPVVGYIGKIQDRVDFDLVEYCLKKENNMDFVFMGPIYSTVKKTVNTLKKEYKNISFIGDVKYEDIPLKMKDIDVAILPHRVNEFTNSMNPIKVYEYLAAGKQVVSTGVAGIDGLSRYIKVTDSNEEFTHALANAVRKAVSDRGLPEKIRKSLDKKFSWKNISKEIISDIMAIRDEKE